MPVQGWGKAVSTRRSWSRPRIPGQQLSVSALPLCLSVSLCLCVCLHLPSSLGLFLLRLSASMGLGDTWGFYISPPLTPGMGLWALTSSDVISMSSSLRHVRVSVPNSSSPMLSSSSPCFSRCGPVPFLFLLILSSVVCLPACLATHPVW